jgi:hypothetical protein
MGSTTITGTVATGAGSATLASLRDRVEQTLSDTANARWTTAAIDEAIRAAIATYQNASPCRAIGTITLAAAGREISIASLTTLIYIERVWWEYTSTDPEYPPSWRNFQHWPGSILWIDDGNEPGSGDVIRIFYIARHTLNGLDSAAITTIPQEHETVIVTGASAYAATNRAAELAEQATVDGWPQARLLEYGRTQMMAFQNELIRIARQYATHKTRIAAAPALDRWDTGW